jgi:hypothetical protein
VVPYLGGSVAALLAGFLIDAALEPVLGRGPTLFVSFVASVLAFYFARKWLKDLADF